MKNLFFAWCQLWKDKLWYCLIAWMLLLYHIRGTVPTWRFFVAFIPASLVFVGWQLMLVRPYLKHVKPFSKN